MLNPSTLVVHGLVLLFTSTLAPSLAQPAPQAGGNSSEAELLLAFKGSFANGDAVLNGWVPGTDPCAWTGISCNARGFVERMYGGLLKSGLDASSLLQLSPGSSFAMRCRSLANRGLIGSIPSNGGWLLPSQLRVLELGDNPISGPVPPSWRLPPTLDTLYMANCGLTGTLSPEWVLSEDMKYLILRQNNFSGPLPEGWRLPKGIMFIDLGTNQFEGTIHESFTTLSSLQILNLQDNRLTGEREQRLPLECASCFAGPTSSDTVTACTACFSAQDMALHCCRHPSSRVLVQHQLTGLRRVRFGQQSFRFGHTATNRAMCRPQLC
jgi:hypothetical protein